MSPGPPYYGAEIPRVRAASFQFNHFCVVSRLPALRAIVPVIRVQDARGRGTCSDGWRGQHFYPTFLLIHRFLNFKHSTASQTELYSSINSTKSPALGAYNIRKPTLMSEVGSRRSLVGVDQRVSAVRSVEVPVLICLLTRSRCNHVTDVWWP